MKNVIDVIKENKKKFTLLATAALAVVLLGAMAACSAVGVSGDIGASDAIGGALSNIAEAADVAEQDAAGTDDTSGGITQNEDEGADEPDATDLTEPQAAAGITGQSRQAVQPVDSASSVQQGSERPTPSTSQKKWVEDTQQVWVEDKAAWSEQVPVYGNKEVSICNVCGADVTGNASAHGKAHMLAGEGSGHHSEVTQVITGYNTVNHPAEGHYETRVTGGHWE